MKPGSRQIPFVGGWRIVFIINRIFHEKTPPFCRIVRYGRFTAFGFIAFSITMEQGKTRGGSKPGCDLGKPAGSPVRSCSKTGSYCPVFALPSMLTLILRAHRRGRFRLHLRS